MKLKMLGTFQGRDVSAVLADEGLRVSILEAGEVYEVDEALGEYLLLHRKAERVASIVTPAPVVHESEPANPAEPEAPALSEELKPEPEPRKRGRRG